MAASKQSFEELKNTIDSLSAQKQALNEKLCWELEVIEKQIKNANNALRKLKQKHAAELLRKWQDFQPADKCWVDINDDVTRRGKRITIYKGLKDPKKICVITLFQFQREVCIFAQTNPLTVEQVERFLNEPPVDEAKYLAQMEAAMDAACKTTSTLRL